MKHFFSSVIPWGLLISGALGLFGQGYLAAASIVLSVAIALWQHITSEIQSERQLNLNKTQAKLLIRGGLGNPYKESILEEMQATGFVANLKRRLEECLEIDPNDFECIKTLAIKKSLQLSEYTAAGVPVDKIEILRTRRLCRRGRRLFPSDHNFPECLGMLADCEGHHEIARFWFKKSGDLYPDGCPEVWRLNVATSYALSGEHQAARKEIELAKASGVENWYADFCMGWALCANGEFEQAIPHLLLASKCCQKMWQTTAWLVTAHLSTGHVFKAAYSEAFLSLQLLEINFLRSVLTALKASVLFVTAMANTLQCWAYKQLQNCSTNSSGLFIRIGPDSLYAAIAGDLCRRRYFRACEILCRKMMKTMPHSKKLLIHLTGALALQGKKDDAIAVANLAISRFPEDGFLLALREQISNPRRGRPLIIPF